MTKPVGCLELVDMTYLLDTDLLRPSLTNEHDKGHFHRPWNPWLLIYLSFFFGLLAGGALLALNYPRLGIKCRVVPAIAVVAIIAIIAILGQGGVTWLLATGTVSVDYSSELKIVLRILSVVISGIMARQQAARYRISQQMDIPSGSILIPGVIASGLSIEANYYVSMSVLQLL